METGDSPVSSALLGKVSVHGCRSMRLTPSLGNPLISFFDPFYRADPFTIRYKAKTNLHAAVSAKYALGFKWYYTTIIDRQYCINIFPKFG